MRFRRITIVQAPAPTQREVNEQLQWLGGSLGLFNERDKDKSCFRIFITLLRSAKRREELTSDELAALTGLSRGTVVHHLNRLMSAGIVESYRSRYVLRVDSLEGLVAKLGEDLDRTLASLKEIAAEIDRKLSP